MISEISIRNFKGIKECDIKNLDRINVFIGRNDICKSTILEAAYYTLKEFAGPHLREIIKRRTNIFFEARELWFNYNMDNPISVALVFDNDVTTTLEISREKTGLRDFDIICRGTAKRGTQRTRSDKVSLYRVADWEIKEKPDHNTDFLDDLPESTRIGTKEYVCKCGFLDSSNRNDTRSIEKLFGSIESEGQTGVFNRYVRTIFEKERNTRIKFKQVQQGSQVENRVVIEERVPPIKREIFLGGFGDGIRYGMQVVGTALVSRNTGMFIEEIESNQHPASLRRIVDFLMDITFKNGLQLFVTTHNVEAFRFFWSHFRKAEFKVDPRAASVRYFHVTRDYRTGKVDCIQVDPHNEDDRRKVESDLFGLQATNGDP